MKIQVILSSYCWVDGMSSWQAQDGIEPDVDASQSNYLKCVADDLKEAFPEAEIEVEWSPSTSLNNLRVYVSGASRDEEDEVIRTVKEIDSYTLWNSPDCDRWWREAEVEAKAV